MLSVSCNGTEPKESAKTDEYAVVSPDYTDIVFPYNIAPLNFTVRNEGDDFITRISGDNGDAIYISGRDVQINLKQWQSLVETNKNKELSYTIFAKRNGKWMELNSFTNHVSEDPIDEYGFVFPTP